MPEIRRHKLPKPLLVQLLTRMRQRNISHEQIILLARWLNPKCRTANGSRNFPA
jgi:hypothetical protein